jgi:hypothetical protein
LSLLLLFHPQVSAAPPTVPPDVSYAASPVTLAEGATGTTYDPTLDAGDPATSYAVTTGVLPAWITLNPLTGVITIGTVPYGTGDSDVTYGITASNSGGAGAEADFRVITTLAAPISAFAGRSIVLGHGPTITINNLGGAAATLEEVAGADDVLSDFNYEIKTANTIGPIDGSGATPPGNYTIRLRQVNATGNGNTIEPTIHVLASAGGGANALGQAMPGLDMPGLPFGALSDRVP